MENPVALNRIAENSVFRKGDVFVLFGELFGRGYATGLLDEARRAGMEIVGITVGRRDENNALRPLNAEELSAAEERLGGRIINIPLMAGFDLDAPTGGPTPTDLLATMTLESWELERLDWGYIEQCRDIATSRFTNALSQVMAVLDGMIAEGRNVFFAHTMAGGIPKAKVFLAVANRIYKGRGPRHMSSQALLDSEMGKLILQNFDEVTAITFRHLIDFSAGIRERVEASGAQVRYTAYGYHGTAILIDGSYRWQTYTNYTQGYAKMRLECIAQEAWAAGVKATVYNCPEIRTNSSDVFTGIELPLIPAATRLAERERWPMGRRPMAGMSGAFGRRLHNEGCVPKNCRYAGQRSHAPVLRLFGVADGEQPSAGRSDHRHVQRDHADASGQQGNDQRPPECSRGGGDRAADFWRVLRSLRPHPVAQPRYRGAPT
ncbi:hypothetical protein ACVINY_004634 [Sinorhizobium meliloti]